MDIIDICVTDVSSVKPERSISPNAMSEEDRRELIARQHRALYGNEASLYSPESGTTRSSQDARVSGAASNRGPSPLAFDPFGMKGQSGADSAVQMPPREQMSAGAGPERQGSGNSPPSSTQASFSMGESTQQPNRTNGSSPSPPLGQSKQPPTTSSGVAPIGTRPAPAQSAATKRATTPNERSTSAASNPALANSTSSLGGWGSNSGVWGPSKNTLGVQASVWG